MGDFRPLGLRAPVPLATHHDIGGFSSGKPAMDAWLADMALHNQVQNYARTFVVCDDNLKIKAYYALCAGMMLRKDAHRKVASHGAPSELPVALLARIAVHRDLQGRGLGKALLANAIRTATSASQAVAFRGLVVDAIDEDARAFYLKLGFVQTRISPMKLILPMQDIIASMFPKGGET